MPPPIRQGMTALRCNEWVSDAPGRLRAKHRTSLPRRHTRSTACARGLKKPLSQQKSLLRVKRTRRTIGRAADREDAPLVAAAWCLTAARSRLNSLSATHEGWASAELKRRWAAERIGAARWDTRAMLRENMVDGGSGFWRGEDRGVVEIQAALVDSRDPPAYVT